MRSVKEAVDSYIALKRSESLSRERSGKYSPSMLGRCFRAQYWNRRNEPVTNPQDERTLRVFEAGHLFHDFVQRVYAPEQCEVLVETEHFKGFADIVDGDTVCDIKSQHSWGFKYFDEEGFEFVKDKKTHVLQALFYAIHLKKPNIKIAYVSKDDLRIREFNLTVSQWRRLCDLEVEYLKKIWAKQELPDAIPRAYWSKKENKFQECKYCPFRDKCKEVGGKVWTSKTSETT